MVLESGTPHEFRTLRIWSLLINRLTTDLGGYYRINGLEPYDRELICSSVSQTGRETNENYQIRIRTYGNNDAYRRVI